MELTQMCPIEGASLYLHVMTMYGGMEVLIHTFLTLALDGGEWSASNTSHFTPRGRSPDTFWRGGWVDCDASLDFVQWRKITCHYWESNLIHPE
jgi:hypothetical protein